MKGYLTQRGFIDHSVGDDVDKAMAETPYAEWSLRELVQRMSGRMGTVWRRFLKTVFNLDSRQRDASFRNRLIMDQCEVAMMAASCRMHITTHMMAEAHPSNLLSRKGLPTSTSGIELPRKGSKSTSLSKMRHIFVFPQNERDSTDKKLKAIQVLPMPLEYRCLDC